MTEVASKVIWQMISTYLFVIQIAQMDVNFITQGRIAPKEGIGEEEVKNL